MNIRIILVVSALSAVMSAEAQQCAPPTPAKVVAFAPGTRLDGVGTSDMPITTENKDAKFFAQQGFAMIHCFWFDEAIRAFRDAVAADPKCAMAWGGLYIALAQPWNYSKEYDAEANFAISRAVTLSESATDAEQKLIVALRAKSLGGDDRDGPFEQAMMGLINDYPKLKEPRLILAGIRCQLCMHVGYLPNGDVRGDLLKVLKLIEPVLKADPMNAGALHYHIHACEPFTPERAVSSADKIGLAAPRSSHMVHMAGHIFNRVGRYADGQRVFARAREIEEQDAKTLGVSPFNANWNYGHNRQFMAANLAEDGKVEEALKAIEGLGWGAVEIRWRAGDWKAAMDLSSRNLSRGGKASQAFFKGMLAAENRDWFTASTEFAKLDASYQELVASAAGGKRTTEQRMRATMRHELAGALRMLEGRTQDAIAEFEKSIDAFHTIEYEEPVIYPRTPYESMGWALFRDGQYEEAIQAFSRGFIPRPNNFWCKKGIFESKQQLATLSSQKLP